MITQYNQQMREKLRESLCTSVTNNNIIKITSQHFRYTTKCNMSIKIRYWPHCFDQFVPTSTCKYRPLGSPCPIEKSCSYRNHALRKFRPAIHQFCMLSLMFIKVSIKVFFVLLFKNKFRAEIVLAFRFALSKHLPTLRFMTALPFFKKPHF